MSPAETQQQPPVPDDPTENLPLLELRDGLSDVVDTDPALAEVVEAFRAGTGPVAVDAERASGYRYSHRAYLVQLRREGSGSALVDPIPFGDLSSLGDAIVDAEWIIHAANQDLACLAEVGMVPRAVFDTELVSGCSATRRSDWRRWSARSSATRCARNTLPPTGRPVRCPAPG